MKYGLLGDVAGGGWWYHKMAGNAKTDDDREGKHGNERVNST